MSTETTHSRRAKDSTVKWLLHGLRIKHLAMNRLPQKSLLLPWFPNLGHNHMLFCPWTPPNLPSLGKLRDTQSRQWSPNQTVWAANPYMDSPWQPYPTHTWTAPKICSNPSGHSSPHPAATFAGCKAACDGEDPRRESSESSSASSWGRCCKWWYPHAGRAARLSAC